MSLRCPSCAADLEAGWLRCRRCGADARQAEEVPDQPPLEFPILSIGELAADPLMVRYLAAVHELAQRAPAVAIWDANGRAGRRPLLVAELEPGVDELLAAVADAGAEIDERYSLAVRRREIAERDEARRAPARNVATTIAKLREAARPHESPAERDRASCEARAWFFNFPAAHREAVAGEEPRLVARAVRLLLASRYGPAIEKQLRREHGQHGDTPTTRSRTRLRPGQR